MIKIMDQGNRSLDQGANSNSLYGFILLYQSAVAIPALYFLQYISNFFLQEASIRKGKERYIIIVIVRYINKAIVKYLYL